jgi:CRP/FNR family cyclic AMP-dependent transcriptional regulator
MNRAIASYEERVEAMMKVPLFSRIGRRDLERIAAVATERQFAAGENIVTQDEDGDSMYVIMEGEAEVLDWDSTVAKLHAGDFLGEMAVLRRIPRSATVRATTDVKALRLTQWDLDAELRNSPVVAVHMLVSMSNRLHSANLEIARLTDALRTDID